MNKKLKIMIVDDEPIICQGLKFTVPWDELEAEVVAEAYDGEEALEIVQDSHVDVILTDVKMPVMDGLELSEQIHQQYPEIHMIMISGYDEFEYAKRAMRQGVKDYLLKPVDIEELMGLIQSIKKQMDKQTQKKWSSSLKQVVSAAVLGDELDLERSPIQDTLQEGYCFFCTEVKDYAERILPLSQDEQRYLKMAWVDELDKNLSAQGLFSVSVFVHENRLLTCCKLHSSDYLKIQMFESAVIEIKKRVGVSLTGCLSLISRSAKEVTPLYQLVCEGIRAHPVMDQDIYEATKVPSRDNVNSYPSAYEKKFNQAGENEEQLKGVARELLEKCKQEQWFLEDLVLMIRELEKHIFGEFVQSSHYRLQEEVDVNIYNSYKQIEQLFLNDLMEYARSKKLTAEGRQSGLIKKAVIYIQDHYNEDLKAAEIADVINVSPNYFSQLIKQETGKHFNEFLHEIRINQAKELLKETPYRIMEIAEMVGYKDYKYFVQIFKRKVDLTPTQYRKVVIQSASVSRNDST
ncbi:response regulator transcription factor [Halobacillus andaensis]|uniref:response regulator transcription factor n=1 Tax=Halobacillus andaensis TaxID=1176239 RepID=UPI003D752F9D